MYNFYTCIADDQSCSRRKKILNHSAFKRDNSEKSEFRKKMIDNLKNRNSIKTLVLLETVFRHRYLTEWSAITLIKSSLDLSSRSNRIPSGLENSLWDWLGKNLLLKIRFLYLSILTSFRRFFC